MKLGVVAGPRYYRLGEQYYTSTSYHADMWKECLVVFDEVILAGRTVHSQEMQAGFKPVLIDGVRVIEFPNFKGFLSLLKAFPKMLLVAKKAVREADVWHLHAPSFGSFCMWFWAWFYRIPYSLELRGEQSMSPCYLRLRGTKFARLVALIMRMNLWLQLSSPIMVVAISQYLINKYKPRKSCPEQVISDNRLPSNIYQPCREWTESQRIMTIVSVGNLEVVKNPLGLLRACSLLNKRFDRWKFMWIGDGPMREQMRDLAKELGISEKVELCGFVPWGDELFGKLRSADLLVVNSMSEGGPRTVYEAMACSLPVIGTPVGNIPTVLAEEDIFPAMRDDLLADKLYEVLSNPIRLTEMARRNEKTAKEYSAEVLSDRKIEFYRQLKELVEEQKR